MTKRQETWLAIFFGLIFGAILSQMVMHLDDRPEPSDGDSALALGVGDWFGGGAQDGASSGGE